MTELDIARRRIESLRNEEEFYARRDALRRELVERGLSAVATAELRLLEEDLTALEEARAAEAEAEIWAEGAWLRKAEEGYPGYDYDPNEATDPQLNGWAR